MLQRFLHVFVYSNIFIAVCSVVMCWYTFYALQISVNTPYLVFVFFATLVSYSFHWYLTIDAPSPSKRLRWTTKNKTVHILLFFTSSIGVLFFGYFLKDFWEWLVLTAVLTFLYSAPKIPIWPFKQLYKIAVGKTIFLALVWMHVTVILPVIFSAHPYPVTFESFALNRFFLIFPICVLFDYRDREPDIKAGIKSMINLLTEKGIDVVFWACLLVFATTSLYLAHRISLPSFLIMITPAIILALLYDSAKKKFTDCLYYFILDGLMMLSGLLAIVFEFWLHLRA